LVFLENDLKSLYDQAIAAVERNDWLDAGVYTGEIIGYLLNQKIN
jgi:hypothetical protein